METALARFVSQPGIELIPADGAKCKAALFFGAHPKTLATEIKMRPIHVVMRHILAVQPEGIQDNLCIRQQPTSAQFRARVVCFFQDECPMHHFRRDLRQVECGGNSRRTCTYNDQVESGWVGHGDCRGSRT